MRNQLFLALGASLALSACFFSKDKNETPSTSGVDMSKPINLVWPMQPYTVSGNIATEIWTYGTCDSGGVFRTKMDTTFWKFTAPSQLLKFKPHSSWTDTLVGGATLENSEWMEIDKGTNYADTSTYLLKDKVVYEVNKNVCMAEERKNSLKRKSINNSNIVVDTNSIVKTGCGTISYNAKVNQKDFKVTESFSVSTTNGVISSFVETTKINDKTCSFDRSKHENPENVTSCKEAWSKYIIDNPNPTRVYSEWHSKYMTYDYSKYDDCIDSAFGITSNQVLPRKQLSRKAF